MTGLLLATFLVTTNMGSCEIPAQEWDGTGDAVLTCDGSFVQAVPIQPSVCITPDTTISATDALCVLRRATGLLCGVCRE